MTVDATVSIAPVDAAMNHKVQAAAKLALQDLDPESVRQRYNFMSAAPAGCLEIHLRHLTQFSRTFFNTSTFNYDDILALYILVKVNYVAKQSRIVHVRRLNKKEDPGKSPSGRQTVQKNEKTRASVGFDTKPKKPKFGKHGGNFDSIQSGKAVVGIDSLKNFQVEVGRQRDDESNMVEFDLVFVSESQEMVQKVGEARCHIFDFVGDMNGTKTIKILSTSSAQATVAELEIDFAFRYGLFGYGYGHQVDQKRIEQKYILARSIFPRVAPPTSRRDDDGLCDVMHVDYPEFIPLEERSHIGSDPIHRRGNKVTEAQMEEGDHVLNIMLNPYLTSTKTDGKDTKNTKSDGESASNASDEEDSEEDLDNMYQVESTEQSRLLTTVLNRRQRLPKMVRQYAMRTTRYERLKYLEHIMIKRGIMAGRTDGDEGQGAMRTLQSAGAEQDSKMELADIMLDMAPAVGTNPRRQSLTADDVEGKEKRKKKNEAMAAKKIMAAQAVNSVRSAGSAGAASSSSGAAKEGEAANDDSSSYDSDSSDYTDSEDESPKKKGACVIM